MLEDKSTTSSYTSLSDLGEFGLIDHLTKKFEIKNNTTIKGVGDDAAVFKSSKGKVNLITCDLLIEGTHFNPTYTPLKHLGYKAAIVNFSDIYAMNGTPKQLVIGIAVSSKYTLEALEELYAGIKLACQKYNVDLVGGDTTSSTYGLQISITVVGEANEKEVCYRNGAKPNDLICVTGDLGASYAGLLILKREEQTFLANPNFQPDLQAYDYVIERQLKPEAKKLIIETLNKHQIVPNSMIDISDGLTSELLHISKQSGTGFKIFENKIPIDQQTVSVAEEFNLAPLTMALNGGEDYEVLFTVDLKHHDILKNIEGVSIIGHVTQNIGEHYLITNAEQAIQLKAQGWDSFKR